MDVACRGLARWGPWRRARPAKTWRSKLSGGFHPRHVDEVLGLVFDPGVLFRLLSGVPGRHHVPGVVVRISPLGSLPIPVELVGDPLLRGESQTCKEEYGEEDDGKSLDGVPKAGLGVVSVEQDGHAGTADLERRRK
ncbi:hypothetical protein OUZ56_017763 [Daphnia magna]|uniref:Uncharacterized protein n=1 Tax=Daphnia magna TaxID=35525 RepID=A0ABR0ATQ0_9CRUS|nr:hypothetical protein OUZ56_017763 [Daphnia magna]